MKKSVLALWAFCLIGLAGTAWWYLFTAGSVPAGQPPLGGESEFRAAFAAGVDKTRIVARFSPTRTGDLAAAAALQALLMEYENNILLVHVIWQPLAETDWAPPATDALGRVWDIRARHYWDKEKRLRPDLGESQVLIYARGADLGTPALRLGGLDNAGVLKIREFMGIPAPMP